MQNYIIASLKKLKNKFFAYSFYKDDKTIKVFEGNGDGSDDKEMDYKTFVKNYDFFVAHEIEQIPLHIKI